MSSSKFSNIFNTYLEQNNNNDELEVRFGTKGIHPLSRVQFDNVIQRLKSKSFKTTGGEYRMTISNQYLDKRSGKIKISNIRTEINSLPNIQKYCKTNIPTIATFNQKKSKYIENERVLPIDFNDFNFRIGLKEEIPLTNDNKLVQSLLSTWQQSKKIFRFIKRFTFRHNDYPLRVDCSIVKTSRKTKHYLIPAYTVEDSNIFNNPESYEIEIEIDNNKDLSQRNAAQLIAITRRVIKIILCGIQETNFPISISEQKKILISYVKLFNKNPPEYIRSSFFLGPSSISLEIPNVIVKDTNINIPNIRDPYTVTEKADGLRKLLYISANGKLYLINTNMNVQFTGCKTSQHELFNSLLDGEHVQHDKMGKFINNFLAFDIYFSNADDVRAGAFVSDRLPTLNKFIKDLKCKAITGKDTAPMVFKTKTFYQSSGNGVFANCKKILDAEKDGLFPYHTDGLIFTPANTGVATKTVGAQSPDKKVTWTASLKWKPARFNTVDFLVTTKKTSTGSEFIGNLFESGEDMSSARQIQQYKTLILRVGYDEKRHGFLNPCQDLIDEKYTHTKGGNNYKPVPFYPSNPSDPTAAFCNVKLKTGTYGNKYMLVENSEETFEDNTIVEFRYDGSKEPFWRWIPIRVRNDKTAEYRRGIKNYGNAYHVAESVWKSIHNPVTSEMLKTGKDIPDGWADDNIYYNRVGKNNTRALRDFHNLYVKRTLLKSISSRGDTLIDLAVGKAGDLPKWNNAHLGFILGIDISKDNIENRNDGACARYLKAKRKFKTFPRALFIEGNSSLNIRTGEAAATEKGKQILRAVFGEGPKDPEKLGAAVYKEYGRGKDGFNIVSCQFALHYFFENENILHEFLRNVNQNCKMGGYFLGTCFDGKKIFNALENKDDGYELAIMKEENKIWSIKKKYSSAEFEDNVTSLGYAIDVYQESINKTFREYLVNFPYFFRLLESYGFQLLTQDEATTFGLPQSSASFKDLYAQMQEQIQMHTIRKTDIGRSTYMTAQEKQISFYNRYFVLKKVRHVENVLRVLSGTKDETTPNIPTPSTTFPTRKLNKRINIEAISL